MKFKQRSHSPGTLHSKPLTDSIEFCVVLGKHLFLLKPNVFFLNTYVYKGIVEAEWTPHGAIMRVHVNTVLPMTVARQVGYLFLS